MTEPRSQTGPMIAAILLAAGKSSRMGRLKQLLQVGDRTLLQATLDAVSQSRVKKIIVVLGYEADTVSTSMNLPSNAQIAINADYEEGMSSSIRLGLRTISPDTKAALIVLSDQPYIRSAVIDQLIEEYERSGAPIVLPVYKGFRGNPVLIDRSLFPEMMQISGDIGCRSIFGIHANQIQKVQVDDIGVLIDVDSPEDLAKVNEKKRDGDRLLTDLDTRDREVSGTKHLVIVGSDELAFALAKIAKALHFWVTVVDPLLSKKDIPEADRIIHELDLRSADATPATNIVIASRGKYDEEALQQAIATQAEYIALVGSKKRGAEILARLKSGPADLQRVRCPAGLAIGASTPGEIALSVMAEIVQQKSKLS